MLVGGLTLMVADSLQAFRAQGSYFSILGRIILEPAAWFLIWNGLELLLDKYRVASREADFYKLLGQLSIRFKDA